MSRPWRKGCLCGCLYKEECAHYEPPAARQIVEHIHHVVIHREPEPELRAWADSVEVVREIES